MKNKDQQAADAKLRAAAEDVVQPAKEEGDAVELTVDNIQSIIERHVYAATMNEHDELIGVEEAAQAIYTEFKTTKA